MRVTCASVDEFLECLAAVTNVYEHTLRVSVFRRPQDNNPRGAVRHVVVLQASAIVQNADGSEYLLETAERSGVDYSDADASDEGSRAAANTRSRLMSYAAVRGWSVLPGVLDV